MGHRVGVPVKTLHGDGESNSACPPGQRTAGGLTAVADANRVGDGCHCLPPIISPVPKLREPIMSCVGSTAKSRTTWIFNTRCASHIGSLHLSVLANGPMGSGDSPCTSPVPKVNAKPDHYTVKTKISAITVPLRRDSQSGDHPPNRLTASLVDVASSTNWTRLSIRRGNSCTQFVGNEWAETHQRPIRSVSPRNWLMSVTARRVSGECWRRASAISLLPATATPAGRHHLALTAVYR